MRLKILVITLASAALAAPALAQDAQELSKKLNNPISDLVSVPFQFNWEFGYGPNDDMHHILNLQPVVPFRIREHTNMIARLIAPTVSVPGATVAGDMTFSLFFSPARSTSWIWGAGPALLLPRSGPKWAVGPTVVALKQKGPVTYGILANQLWSVAGDNAAADVNQTFLQPFFAHTDKNAITYSVNSETTVNWEAPSGDQWTIPLNFLVSKFAKFGQFPTSYGAGIGIFVDSPSGGPEWKLRAVMTLILPNK